jgi:hypothetical protein
MDRNGCFRPWAWWRWIPRRISQWIGKPGFLKPEFVKPEFLEPRKRPTLVVQVLE